MDNEQQNSGRSEKRQPGSGNPHEVLEVSGDKVLLVDIMSWVKKSVIEILATNKAIGNVELKQ